MVITTFQKEPYIIFRTTAVLHSKRSMHVYCGELLEEAFEP